MGKRYKIVLEESFDSSSQQEGWSIILCNDEDGVRDPFTIGFISHVGIRGIPVKGVLEGFIRGIRSVRRRYEDNDGKSLSLVP